MYVLFKNVCPSKFLLIPNENIREYIDWTIPGKNCHINSDNA